MRHQDQEADPGRQIEHDERDLKRSTGHVSHPAKGRAEHVRASTKSDAGAGKAALSLVLRSCTLV